MTAIFGFLTGKIAGPAFLALAVALAIALATVWLVDRIRIGGLENDVADLRQQIYAPATGYVAREAQCQTNTAQLQSAVKILNASIDKLAANTEAGNAALAKAMAAVAAQTRTVQASTAKLLNLPATAPPGTLQACLAGGRILKTGAP